MKGGRFLYAFLLPFQPVREKAQVVRKLDMESLLEMEAQLFTRGDRIEP